MSTSSGIIPVVSIKSRVVFYVVGCYLDIKNFFLFEFYESTINSKVSSNSWFNLLYAKEE